MDEIRQLLTPEWVRGRDLRNRLNAGKWWWQRWSGPGFYARMATLVDEGWALQKHETIEVEGVPIKVAYFRSAPWDE
jgi:hypothetical protein